MDGRELRDALLRVALRNGAKLINGDAVLEHSNNEITGVKVGQQTYTADEVLICAGAWSNHLLHPLGITTQVYYQKAQIMHLQLPMTASTEQWPVVMPPNDQYLLAFPGNRIVIGATHENDVEGYDTSVTAGGMHEVLSKGLQTSAGLADCRLHEVRVGFRPYTANFLPVLGRVAGWNKLIVANGLGSSGLTMGPFLGGQLAKLAMNQQVDIELEHYALEHAVAKK